MKYVLKTFLVYHHSSASENKDIMNTVQALINVEKCSFGNFHHTHKKRLVQGQSRLLPTSIAVCKNGTSWKREKIRTSTL